MSSRPCTLTRIYTATNPTDIGVPRRDATTRPTPSYRHRAGIFQRSRLLFASALHARFIVSVARVGELIHFALAGFARAARKREFPEIYETGRVQFDLTIYDLMIR